MPDPMVDDWDSNPPHREPIGRRATCWRVAYLDLSQGKLVDRMIRRQILTGAIARDDPREHPLLRYTMLNIPDGRAAAASADRDGVLRLASPRKQAPPSPHRHAPKLSKNCSGKLPAAGKYRAIPAR